MDVACSTLCFTREPLVQALRMIAELEFTKVDLAVGDGNPHVSTEAVVSSPATVLNELKLGPTLAVSAITLRTALQGEPLEECIDAAAHLCKLVSAPVLTIEAAPVGTPIEREAARLRRVVGVAAVHGVTVAVATRTGAMTETPTAAAELCERVEGLKLTLDPSHFLCGPNQGRPFDEVYAYVEHVHLRDSARRMDQFQVTVGRGEIEYGKIINSLCRFGYRGVLTVAMEDQLATGGFDPFVESRKLRLLLESYLVQRDSVLFRAA